MAEDNFAAGENLNAIGNAAAVEEAEFDDSIPEANQVNVYGSLDNEEAELQAEAISANLSNNCLWR